MDHSEVLTGADDWRSASEKQKSLLRKAAIGLLKIWIPDHPEASMARQEFYRLWRDAMHPGCTAVTFVSMLSSGVEDIVIYDFERNALSLQGLLVQREGTEAFLDARNALRVVRRKFGMMTLISRLAGLFEQRNLHAITLDANMNEADHLSLAKLISTRAEGTSVEEEQRFKGAWRRAQLRSASTFFHSEIIGRRLPVSWPIKAFYSLLARQAQAGRPHAEAAAELMAERFERIPVRDLGPLAQNADRLCADLEAPDGFDPADAMLTAAAERPLLGVTRRMYDDFRLIRRERGRHRNDEDLSASLEQSVEGLDADGLLDATQSEDDELRRLAQGLERIRQARGPEFFNRMAAGSEALDFGEALDGSIEQAAKVEDMHPLEAFAHARAVHAPYYQARALASVTPRLVEANQGGPAADAARLCWQVAQRCEAEDRVEAMVLGVEALLHARLPEPAADAVSETLALAHQQRPVAQRAEALMRVASALFEAGGLPQAVRARLSSAFLSDDVHFWSKPEVTPALVETCLGLLSARDDDTIIFLQKVVAHPDEAVRCSVLRAMPVGDDVTLRNVLLTHLKDPSPAVRGEVIERIGTSGERGLFIYLANHVRHGTPPTPEEARGIALALCRLDAQRALPFLNAMLGKLAVPDKALLKVQAPLKHADEASQLAALEALYRHNGRAARRLLFQLSQKKIRGGGLVADTIARIWPLLKSAPYGEPDLPRSAHDPEWTEADEQDFLALIAAAEPEAAPVVMEDAAPAAEPKRGGFFSKLKGLLHIGDEAPPEETPADAPDDEPAPVAEVPAIAPAVESAEPAPVARAALQFEGVLLEGPELWNGKADLAFALYADEDGSAAIWQEALTAVPIRRGTFSVHLGLQSALPEIPKVAWLGMAIDGGHELRPRTRLGRARTIVQG